MAKTRGEELADLAKDMGGEIAILMFTGKHSEAQYAARVMVAQGELLLAFYQDDMSAEELDIHRQRLASIEME